MPTIILHAGTALAVYAATDQEAQLAAFVAPWAGGAVVLRYYSAADVLLDTVTHAAWVQDNTVPRQTHVGAITARTFAAAGTAAYVIVAVPAGDDILRSAAVMGAAVSSAARTSLVPQSGAAGLVVRSDSGLPVSVGNFASVTLDTADANVPSGSANQVVIVELHGSGTAAPTLGAKYLADMSTGGLGYSTDTTFRFALANGGTIDSRPVCVVRPWDRQGTYPDGTTRRESYWMGWTDGPDTGEMRLYTEHRLDRMIDWIKANQANLSATRWVLSGGSMGGWGTLTFGVRRPHIFPALWADRPRWRNSDVTGSVRIPSWTVAVVPAYTFAAAPNLVADDGGASTADHMDIIAYVSNPSNPVPWIGWHIGRLDGYMPFQDHIDAIAALRAAGRGFAVYWNNDGHTLDNYRAAEISGSYPMGSFELGKGYPVFSEFSLDDDPAVDLVGGINVGLNFRNVVETSSTWSCEVRYQGTPTRATQACTVYVTPKSSIYTGTPIPQLVNLPAAAGWVAVSF